MCSAALWDSEAREHAGKLVGGEVWGVGGSDNRDRRCCPCIGPTERKDVKGQGHILFPMVDFVGTHVKTNARLFQAIDLEPQPP